MNLVLGTVTVARLFHRSGLSVADTSGDLFFRSLSAPKSGKLSCRVRDFIFGPLFLLVGGPASTD